MLAIPNVTIHPNCLSTYSQLYTDDNKLYSTGRNDIGVNRKTNISKLSQQSKKKLSRAINYMCHISPTKKVKGVRYNGTFKFKISFVTLTLSSIQTHTDAEIKSKCLAPFLDYMRKVYSAKQFVWKAEKQKNGNVHFHILFNVFVPYEVLRKKWNQYQNNLGYIDNYFNNHSVDIRSLSNADILNQVNSTDIHSVKNIRDLNKYMLKYMVKIPIRQKFRVSAKKHNIKKSFVKGFERVSSGAKLFLKRCVNTGRLWSCSYDLVNLKGGNDLISSCYDNEINTLINSGKCFVKKEQYFTYLSYDNNVLKEFKCYNLINLLNDFLREQFQPPNTLL